MERDIAVGFDFDHTLGIDNKLERTVALEMLAELGAAHGTTYDVAAAGEAVDATLVLYRSGAQSVESAIAGLFERFVPVGAASAARSSTRRRTFASASSLARRSSSKCDPERPNFSRSSTRWASGTRC
jgi:hypothetical protein